MSHTQTLPSAELSNAVWREAFEHAPISLWIEDYTEAIHSLKELAKQGVKDLSAHLHQNPELIQRLAKQVQILDANIESANRFGDKRSRDKLIGPVDRFLIPEALPVFADELIALYEGRDHHETIVTTGTLEKDPVNTRMHLRVLKSDPSRVLALLTFVILP